MSSAIDASLFTSGTTNTNISAVKDKSALGKDEFLKLLMTQMQNQDPTKPMDDTQSIAQLAQFSSLEQMQNLNTAMTSLKASNMIGDVVGFTDGTKQVAGVVNGVNITKGVTNLVVGVDAVQYNQYLPAVGDSLTNYPVSWRDDSQVIHAGVITSSKVDSNGIMQVTAVETDSAGKTTTSTFPSTQVTRLIVPTKVDVSAVTDITR